MTEQEKRYAELVIRLSTLEQMREGHAEQMNNKAYSMLAKAMSGESDKMEGMSVLIERWIAEIQKEVDLLGKQIADALFGEINEDVKRQNKES